MQSVRQIQKTNDFSTVSKYSTCCTGYMQDMYLQYFIGKRVRRAPIIHRGYYVRMHAVQSIVRSFLDVALARMDRSSNAEIPALMAGEVVQNLSKPIANVDLIGFQIIILGAGYDTLFFRLQEDNVRFIEIDFLEVVQNKAAIILTQPEMREKLNDLVDSPHKSKGFRVELLSSNYVLVGMDMRKHENFLDLFSYLELDRSLPTMVLSEVVLTYIEDKYVKEILQTLSGMFSNAVLVNYEQVEPFDAFGRFMLNHFKKQGSPLLNLEKYPTVSDQKIRYLNAGWQNSEALSVLDYWLNCVSDDDKHRVDQLEPFDEYEEFFEKCRHYVICLAVKGDMSVVLKEYHSMDDPSLLESASPLIPFLSRCVCSPVSLYAHAAEVIILDDFCPVVVLVGGISRNIPILPASWETGIIQLEMYQLSDRVKCIWIPSEALSIKFKRPLVHHTVVRYPDTENDLLIMGGRTAPDKPNDSIFHLRFRSVPSYVMVGVCIDEIQQDKLPRPFASNRCNSAVLGAESSEAPSRILLGGCESAVSKPTMRVVSATESTLDFMTVLDSGWASCSLTSWSNTSQVVVSGGIGKDQITTGDVYLISPQMFKECNIAKQELIPSFRLTFPRFGHTSHVWKDLLVIVGGVSHLSTPVPDVTVVCLNDLSKTEWNFRLKLPNESDQSVKFIGVAVPVSLTFLDNIGCVARVHGSSMLPTLQGDYHTPRDHIWLNALAVRNFDVVRGEIVAFTSPLDPHRILIKRVVGVEGDIIRTLSYKRPVVRVREGSIWVEGDNKDLSMDSNTFGQIPRGLVLGKATHIVWPPSRWTKFKNHIVPDRFTKSEEGVANNNDTSPVLIPGMKQVLTDDSDQDSIPPPVPVV